MNIDRNKFPEDPVVEYEKMRSRIKTGDVVLFSGTGKFSRAIQKITKSVWSHVGVVLVAKELGRVFILESLEPHGVRAVRLSKVLEYRGGVIVARHINFPTDFQHQARAFAQYATDLLGAEYDASEIARHLRNSVRDKIGLPKVSYRVNSNYICSEYVADCFLSVGVQIDPDKMPDASVTPADYANKYIHLVGVLKRPG